MLKFESANENWLLVMRLKGMQSIAEFGASAIKIFEDRKATRGQARILFDWTAIKNWVDDESLVSSCQKWRPSAKFIERGAIIHDRQWDRQAAAFAAVLRVNGCLVRSWTPQEMKMALDWLKEPKQPDAVSPIVS